jgi:hypothetical protein
MVRQQIYKGELNLDLLNIINNVFDIKGLDRILLTEYDPSEKHTRLKGYIFINDELSINYKGEKAVLTYKRGYIIDKITLESSTFKEFLEDFVADYIIASRKIDSLKDKITPNFIESFKRENKINNFIYE